MIPGYPERLASIVMTALERDPPNRFQTADDFRASLEQDLVEERMLVSQASVGQLVKRVLGGGLAVQHEAIRAALVAADGMLRAGLVPESDPRASRPFERLSEPPSQSTGGGGPFNQTVGSWPRPRRAPIGPILFGVLGVASAVAAIIWTTQSKPTALVTAPGSPEKPSAASQTSGQEHASLSSLEGERPTGEGLNTLPLSRAAAPLHPAPAPAAARQPSETEARSASKPSDKETEKGKEGEASQEKVDLEESETRQIAPAR
jgi:serine/threonine-protein kinase